MVVNLVDCDSLTRELTAAWLCLQPGFHLNAHNQQGAVTAFCNRIEHLQQAA